MTTFSKIILGIIVILIIFIAIFLAFDIGRDDSSKMATFEDCMNSDGKILESYPRQCVSVSGDKFVENIGNEQEKIDLIRVSFPRPNQLIESPLKLSGIARGFWSFEAVFPVELLDGNGRKIDFMDKDGNIVDGIAHLTEDWMTEDFVPFFAELNFNFPKGKKGTLILKKSNMSDLPENDDSLVIPIVFAGDKDDLDISKNNQATSTLE